MNYLQLLLFGLYSLSVLLCGLFIYQILDNNYSQRLNKTTLLGEVLLLGSIFVIGQLLFLSVLHLYKAPYLWGCIVINYAAIFNRNVRKGLQLIFSERIRIDLPVVIFFLILLIWIFRNYFPLIESDSVSLYLFIQKLWVSKGTSLFGGPLNDGRIFNPNFNCVPYSLGISVFPNETLFPQFINIFWRFIALVLVFGYTSYRFNRWLGLAAAMFVLFEMHFFYSGAALCLVVNGAIVALFFATIYNFWESRSKDSTFRFLLAIIFASQVMANKYQMAYVLIFTLILCLFMQQKLAMTLKEIINNRRWLAVFLFSCLISGFWIIRNLIITGDPVFPIFAGKLGIFNWTPEKDFVSGKWLAVHLSPTIFLKYMTYMFIWPGITALKCVIVTVLALPFILGFLSLKSRLEEKISLELFFWLSIIIVSVFGIFLAGWTDIKFYRYAAGVFAFGAVFSLYYIFTQFLRIKNQFILCGCILLLAFMGGRNEGWGLILRQGQPWHFTTFRENLDTIRNKIHSDYALVNWHSWCSPQKLSELLANNKEKLARTAWDFDSFGHVLPVFFFQDLPVVSVWVNSAVRWDHYSDPVLIVKNLKDNSIDWVITLGPKFETAEEYARKAVLIDRYPKETYFNFDFPDELSRVKY